MTKGIENKSPIGLRSPRPIEVYRDGENDIFHLCNYANGGEFRANLPAGKWRVEGTDVKKGRPFDFYKRANPGKPDRNIYGAYEIEFEPNPRTGTIDHGRKVIILDNSLLNQPEHVRKFVILHELAHKKFKDEHKCDLKAARELLKMGFNPSQVVEGRSFISGRDHHLTKLLSQSIER